MQHFISNSPWSGREMIAAMQAAVASEETLTGGVLIVDESGDEKTGEASAGVLRQYNGRHKQVETSQVGVFAAYAKGDIWTWVDGELFIPERWFGEDFAARREKAAIPAQRGYQKKTQLGWQMIERAQAAGIPFVAVTFDSLYGQDSWLRDQCGAAGLEYYAEVKSNMLVYVQDPSSAFVPNSKGRIPKQPQVLSKWWSRVDDLVDHPDMHWQRIVIRPDARGMLEADFAALPVWTVRQDGRVVQETLLLRRYRKRLIYTLTNAPLDTPLEVMAQRKTQRYFVERSIQDAKSEFGWAEFRAVRYRAWEHHLALTILASWFVAQTRLDWQLEHPPDPALLDSYATDVLPSLSVANVRELLRASLPLPQLSPRQAALLVAKHLDNRTRSRRSRIKNRSSP